MHTKTPETLIQLNLTILQSQINAPLVYDIESDKIYIVKQQNNSLLYYDIVGESEQIHFDLSPEKLIYPLSLNNQNHITGINRDKQTINGQATEIKQTLNTKTIIQQTEQNKAKTQNKQHENKDTNENETPKLNSRKRQKIADFYNIADFSSLYAKGIIKQTTKEIFFVTTDILANTKTQNVIDETLILYEKARKHAKNGQPTDINALRKILKQLQTKRNRQKGINKSRLIYTEKQQKRLKIKIFTSIVIALFIALFFFHKYNVQKPMHPLKVIITKNIIIKSIHEFETQKKIKVYQWRQNKIIETLSNKEFTPKEFADTLKYYINVAWK